MMSRTFSVRVPTVDDIASLAIEPAVDQRTKKQVADKESGLPFWNVNVYWIWRDEDGAPTDIIGQTSSGGTFSMLAPSKPTPADVMRRVADDLAKQWTLGAEVAP